MSMSHGFDAFGIDKPRIDCLRQREVATDYTD